MYVYLLLPQVIVHVVHPVLVEVNVKTLLLLLLLLLLLYAVLVPVKDHVVGLLVDDKCFCDKNCCAKKCAGKLHI